MVYSMLWTVGCAKLWAVVYCELWALSCTMVWAVDVGCGCGVCGVLCISLGCDIRLSVGCAMCHAVGRAMSVIAR